MEEIKNLVYYWAAADPGYFVNNEKECIKQLENAINEYTKMKGYNIIYTAEIGGGNFEFEVTSYGIEIKDSDRRDDDYAFLILDFETLKVIEIGHFNTVWGEEYVWRIQDYLKQFPLPKFLANE